MGSFGANLRNIRNCWGETLVDLASILDTNVSTVSQWENGKRTPSNDILKLLSLHYQVTIDDLLYGDFSEFPSMVDYFVNLKDGGDALIKEGMRLFPLFATESEKEDARFLKALEIVNEYKSQVINEFNEIAEELDKNKFNDLILTKDTLIRYSGLSLRAKNGIFRNVDTIKALKDVDSWKLTIGHFENNLTRRDLFKFRNIGKKTIEEIISVFLKAGVIIE